MRVMNEKGKLVKIWDNFVPIEEGAIRQLMNVACLPFIYKWVSAMPDVHCGVGSTIGSVIATNGAIIPSAVGVDIGCGVCALKLNLKRENIDVVVKDIRRLIENRIPSGRTNNGKKGDRGSWGDIPERVQQVWDKELKDEFEKLIAKHHGAKPYNLVNHLGTLGGGNHYCELCFDLNDNIWVVIHSGSRGPGNKFGDYFIRRAKEECEKWFIDLPDPDLAYFPQGTELFDDYLKAAKWAQKFAYINRILMMEKAIEIIEGITGENNIVDEDVPEINCHHNYVAWENHFGKNVLVTRKGAIRAREGDWGIIPGSMGARSYIVKGKGNKDSFTSCSHGAGRLMSRTAAKKTINMEEHLKALEGVECNKGEDVLDESPLAYKNIDDVMKSQEDLVEIVYTLKQIICVKGVEK